MMKQATAKSDFLSPIVQAPLGRIASERLRQLILAGELEPGAPLKERELALALGISRTPVREALAELESEGLVRGGGRHFVVAPLERREIGEIYSMIAALERAAVRQIEEPASTLLSALKRARKLSVAANGNVRRLVASDASWHRTLVEASGNRRLSECAERLRMLATRYELAFFRNSAACSNSQAEHERVEELLAAGDRAAAGDAIEEHWLGNVGTMNRAITDQP